jgi:hypothetical protein
MAERLLRVAVSMPPAPHPALRNLLVIVGLLPLLIAVGTFFAGERIEVVVLRTLDSQGVEHDTKLWIVDHEGHPWVRVSRPHFRWLERVRANPHVVLIRKDTVASYRAIPVETPEAKRAIDAAMTAKYGWIDRWYEMIVHDEAIPIRLDPAPGS